MVAAVADEITAQRSEAGEPAVAAAKGADTKAEAKAEALRDPTSNGASGEDTDVLAAIGAAGDGAAELAELGHDLSPGCGPADPRRLKQQIDCLVLA